MDILSVARVDEVPETGLMCKDKSLAQQHLASETDINKIIARYEKTGMVTHLTEAIGEYGDFSDVQDLQSALQTVRNAEGLFNALSADVRERFDNDPVKLLAFVKDAKNRAEAKELGLLRADADVGAGSPDKGDTPVESNPSASGAPPAGA